MEDLACWGFEYQVGICNYIKRYVRLHCRTFSNARDEDDTEWGNTFGWTDDEWRFCLDYKEECNPGMWTDEKSELSRLERDCEQWTSQFSNRWDAKYLPLEQLEFVDSIDFVPKFHKHRNKQNGNEKVLKLPISLIKSHWFGTNTVIKLL